MIVNPLSYTRGAPHGLKGLLTADLLGLITG